MSLDPNDRTPVPVDVFADAVKAKFAELDQTIAELKRRIEALERPWIKIEPMMPSPADPAPEPWPASPWSPWWRSDPYITYPHPILCCVNPT